MDNLKIIYKKTEDLIPYINNPRNNDNAVDKVASSIKNFGFKVPIVVDGDNEIIAGHTRLKAAKKLGMDEVPCIVADDLNDGQIKAFRLADNRVAEFAEWDMELLESELEELKDYDLGFEFDDMGMDFSDLEGIEVVTETVEAEEDDFDEESVKDDGGIVRGDIFQLGNHRLMCGDSTDEKDVKILTRGGIVDMVFTDPPYNIGYKGVSDKREIINDKMTDDEFLEFLKRSIPKCETAYVCCSWQYAHLFKQAMVDLGMPPKAMIVWDKVNPAQNLDKYYKRHELIYYYGKFGGEKTLRGDVWSLKRQKNTLHPTMKPIELIALCLGDNPDLKNVYDGFGGSGSTLIACEQLNRNCYMMEYDPHYVNVIIKRWEELTGKKAIKLND